MKLLSWVFILAFITSFSYSQEVEKKNYQVISFGKGGQIKMLYDRRQRPQSVFLNGKIHIAYNAGADKGATGQSKTKPMIVTYDVESRKFSETVVLGKASKDHHYGPVVWIDNKNYIHLLSGCHRTPGTHLVSKKPEQVGESVNDWDIASEIAPGISYPTLYRVTENKQLIYYRTEGHISSWTYRISDDNGETWVAPEKDVTDFDSKGRFEWSTYQTILPDKDGKFLHVVLIAYDDNRSDDPERYYNSRYKIEVSNEWKYNLYYLKVDLLTNDIYNFEGKKMVTPVDLDYANQNCLIWDTEGRGAGVPPEIVIDKNGNPAFLHVLSEENTETHNYYFVRNENGSWKKAVVAPSNHQWNSCHIQLDKNGVYHAYIVTGDNYLDTEWVEGKSKGDKFKKGTENYLKTGGFMDKHGGGHIEEWISEDMGNTWVFLQDITPAEKEYQGWKFNNIQPVTNPDGSIVEGMLLFYGWKHKDDPKAKAFLLHEKSLRQ